MRTFWLWHGGRFITMVRMDSASTPDQVKEEVQTRITRTGALGFIPGILPSEAGARTKHAEVRVYE